MAQVPRTLNIFICETDLPQTRVNLLPEPNTAGLSAIILA